MRPIERVAPLVAGAVALLASLIGAGAALSTMVSEARAQAAAQSPEFIASTKVYDLRGKLISDMRGQGFQAEPSSPMSGIAARLLPPEVNCTSSARGTTCVETTPAPLARRLRSAVAVAGPAVLAATLLGLWAGWMLGRGHVASLRRVGDVARRATEQNAYSTRAEVVGGEAGRTAAALNDLLTQMHQRDVELRRRSVELEAANRELEAFAYSVSHDLRAPLGSVDGFVQAIQVEYEDVLDATAKEYFGWIREGCRQMRDLIDGLLQMTRVTRTDVQRELVDLSVIAESVAESLQQTNPSRQVRFDIRKDVRTVGDERLLRAVVENLMSNAWKFTRNRPVARIEFGEHGGAFYVRDNGAGFDPSHAAKMFRPFQRLHSTREFEGTGIGLATVQKIVERHGGRAWAEGEVEKGATIYFTTGAEEVART